MTFLSVDVAVCSGNSSLMFTMPTFTKILITVVLIKIESSILIATGSSQVGLSFDMLLVIFGHRPFFKFKTARYVQVFFCGGGVSDKFFHYVTYFCWSLTLKSRIGT